MSEHEIKCYTLKQYNDLDHALFQNIDYGDQEYVEDLIQQGANIQGFALIVAIQAGELEIVKRLVALGSEINVRYRDTTPLIHAVTGTEIPILRFLLAAGADPYLTNSKGQLPIDVVRNGKLRPGITKTSPPPLIPAQPGELRLGTTPAQRQEMIDLLEQYMASYPQKPTSDAL